MDATGWQAHSVRGFLSGTLQETGFECRFGQIRSRRAHLLYRKLKRTLLALTAPPGFPPAAFLVLEDPQFPKR
jgi:hypothetical protein